jgi:hypothetical protein
MLYLLPSCLTNFKSMHLGFHKKSIPAEMDSQIRCRERGGGEGWQPFWILGLELMHFYAFFYKSRNLFEVKSQLVKKRKTCVLYLNYPIIILNIVV